MDYTKLFNYLKSDSMDPSNPPREIQFVHLSDLMQKDENGITYFEHLCKKKVKLTFIDNIFNDIENSNLDVLYSCAKYNYFSYFDNFSNEDLFFEEVEPGVKLIDYLVNNKVELSSTFLRSFRNRTEILDYYSMLRPTPYSMAPYLADKLLTLNDGKYLIDKYLSNPKIVYMIVKNSTKSVLLNYCNDTKNLEPLKFLDEKSLLMRTDNGKKIIEYMLENNIEPLFPGYSFDSLDILRILVKKDRLDLLYNANLKILSQEIEPGKTYFDILIEKQKSGIDAHLEQINYLAYRIPNEIKAEALIKLAKNDLIGFVPSITSNDLIAKGRDEDFSILEYLIEYDRETTINKIIPACRQQFNENFVIILKNLGIDDSIISINPEEKLYSDKLRDKYNNEYALGCMSACPELIKELHDLFINDGKSNEKLIDCLVSSYTYLTDLNHPNHELFITELRQLIAIKKQHYDTFIYDRVFEKNNFNGTKVSMDDVVIPTINHETSHALHFFLSDYKIPDNYDEIIERARNSEGMIQKVKEYSQLFNEIRDKVNKEVSESEIASNYESHYQGDVRLDLSIFLSKSKDKLKKIFSEDFNEQVLDTILAKTYSVDEFIAQKTKIEKRNVADAILRNSYDCLCSIGDIIDAIYEGKFRNNALFDEEGNIIQKSYGHGISYFSRSGNGFKEMVAEYGTIIKSNHSDQMIEYLRSIVGDEIVDMLKDMYENEMLHSNIYLQDVELEETANAR